MAYIEKFTRALTRLSEVDDFEQAVEKWRYAGGESERHLNYFNLIKDDYNLEHPHKTDRCLCSHPIEENCYIRNIDTNYIAVVGNCCIKKFIPKKTRTCSECDSVHKNRKSNLCNDCQKVVCDYCNCEIKIAKERGSCQSCTGKTLGFGKYGEYNYREVVEEFPDYCIWLMNTDPDTRSSKMIEFLRWIKKNRIHIPRNMTVGKYKGQTYEWIMENDPQYCDWVLSMDNLSGAMESFSDFLYEHR